MKNNLIILLNFFIFYIFTYLITNINIITNIIYIYIYTKFIMSLFLYNCNSYFHNFL